jgi:hypothetical protein
MKWEIYRDLNSELQKEYDWRFRDKIEKLISPHYTIFLNMILSIAALMGVCYLMLQTNVLPEKYDSIISLIDLSIELFKLLFLFIVLDVGTNIFFIIRHIVQYKNWKNKNNIKEGFNI